MKVDKFILNPQSTHVIKTTPEFNHFYRVTLPWPTKLGRHPSTHSSIILQTDQQTHIHSVITIPAPPWHTLVINTGFLSININILHSQIRTWNMFLLISDLLAANFCPPYVCVVCVVTSLTSLLTTLGLQYVHKPVFTAHTQWRHMSPVTDNT